MISADRIKVSDDGRRAWWAWGGNGTAHPPADLLVLDRLCDLCNGTKKVRGVNAGPGDLPFTCPDCHGSGRHCFDIEVRADGPEPCNRHDPCDCGCYRDAYGGRPHCKMGCGFDDPSSWPVRTLTVSVVPNMVLPVVGLHPFGPLTHADGYALLLPDGTGQVWQAAGMEDSTIIDLPAATNPGDWLVALDIHQGEPT